MFSSEGLEALASEKGGIRRLLEEQWAKVYRAHAPRGMFHPAELREAVERAA